MRGIWLRHPFRGCHVYIYEGRLGCCTVSAWINCFIDDCFPSGKTFVPFLLMAYVTIVLVN